MSKILMELNLMINHNIYILVKQLLKRWRVFND